MAVSKRAQDQSRRTKTVANATSAVATKAATVSGATDVASPSLVGSRLRAQRLSRGISLRQFARDLDVSASFISQLETGKAQPSVATLFAICSALDISTDELFEGASTTTSDVSEVAAAADGASGAWRPTGYGDLTGARPQTREGVPSRTSRPVVHPSERKVLVLDSGVTWESLTATHHEKTDFMFVRYEVGGSSTMEGRLIRHIGIEYGYILRGSLEITLSFETFRLEAGDSISFDSSRPHRLANVGDVPVEAIWFNLEQFPAH